MSFDGVDDYVSIANTPSINPNFITLSVTFKLRNNTTQTSFLSKGWNSRRFIMGSNGDF
jgi:hypothetical protein